MDGPLFVDELHFKPPGNLNEKAHNNFKIQVTIIVASFGRNMRWRVCVIISIITADLDDVFAVE
jgi:hypothetical protein